MGSPIRYLLMTACVVGAAAGVVAFGAGPLAAQGGVSQPLMAARLPIPMLAADDADGPPPPAAPSPTPTQAEPGGNTSRDGLAGDVTYTSTTILVRGLPPSDVLSLPFEAEMPTRIRIDTEDMLVVDPVRVTGTDRCAGDFQCWRYSIVQRAAFGTEIAEHRAGAKVLIYKSTFP